MRRLPLVLALVLAPLAAEAQLAKTWLRAALTPPNVLPRLERSAAVFPPQQIHLRFSHAQHAKAEVDCTQCHDAVEKSRRAEDLNIPKHEQCESCHDIEAAKKGEATDPLSSCEACHPGVKSEADPYVPNVFPTNNLKFPHDVHVKKGVTCQRCHEGIEQATLGTRDHLMKMVECLSCHDGAQAPNKCTTCHLAEPDGVMVTRFASGSMVPSGQLRDDDHGRDFLRRHAGLAQSDLESCSTCHRAAECEACHVSTSKAFLVHPPDFMASHGMQARSQAMDCTACHREQTFCMACHQQTGAAADSRLRLPPGQLAGAKFHPDGFMTPGTATFHAFAAQQNMDSCASCHQEQTCMKCHATAASSGANINPHPPGFKASGAACRAFKQAPVACAKCHGGGAGLTPLGQLLVGCP
jgi:c(7)-type cytochrome triheme protein